MVVDRIMAFFLDLAIVHFLSTGWITLVREQVIKNIPSEAFDNPFLLWAQSGSHFIFSIVIWFAYFSLFLTFFSETPGMAVFDLKIRRISKSLKGIGWREGTVRTIGLILEFFILGFGLLPVLFSSSGRALHDCLSDTMVVRASTQDLPVLDEAASI